MLNTTIIAGVITAFTAAAVIAAVITRRPSGRTEKNSADPCPSDAPKEADYAAYRDYLTAFKAWIADRIRQDGTLEEDERTAILNDMDFTDWAGYTEHRRRILKEKYMLGRDLLDRSRPRRMDAGLPGGEFPKREDYNSAAIYYAQTAAWTRQRTEDDRTLPPEVRRDLLEGLSLGLISSEDDYNRLRDEAMKKLEEED